MTPEIDTILQQLSEGSPVTLGPFEQVFCKIAGHEVTFNLDRVRDPIQRNNRAGKFYEQKELTYLGRGFPKGGTFVDIGANIGNHSLYFALIGGAAKVVPVEPNPVAYRLLIANILSNRLADVVDLSRLGVGVSDVEADGFAMEDRDRNIGAARMIPNEGTIKTLPGDVLCKDLEPDLIKVDVEGMELLVLAGLAQTIQRRRPKLFVEVDIVNEQDFLVWAKANGYREERVWQRYKSNKNYLLSPT